LGFIWIHTRLVPNITALPSAQVKFPGVQITPKNRESFFQQLTIGRVVLTLTLMSNAYLLKTEPSEYSFAKLQKDKQTIWDGVHNPVALRNLGAMKPGDKLIIYETGDTKSAVGHASVVAVNDPNPKNPQIEIAAGKALSKPVTLAEIKANKLFATSPLVRMGRLSVVPLTAEQFKFLAG